MNYANTPAIELERELEATERKRSELLAALASRKGRPGTLTMRDSRLALSNMNTAAAQNAPESAGAIITDC